MNTFTADKAKELSSISRNNHSAIVNYIMYHAFLGHDFIMLTKGAYIIKMQLMKEMI